MRRLFAVVATAITVACLTAPMVNAAPPTHEPVSFVDRTFSGQCSFDVFRHVLENNSTLTTSATKTFDDRHVHQAGFTNVSTGKFIDVNASGPILAVFHADGSSTEYLRGRQFVRPFGQLLITTGKVVVERDPLGVIVGFGPQGGTSENVCELLA